tara:strand:+ start:1743 stop:2042 length:300 start_codon:yes stop_codon:yes gene_type:complete
MSANVRGEAPAARPLIALTAAATTAEATADKPLVVTIIDGDTVLLCEPITHIVGRGEVVLTTEHRSLLEESLHSSHVDRIGITLAAYIAAATTTWSTLK